MRTITLDANKWGVPGDFCDAIVAGLGAPDWHGRNLDALADSISGGQINAVEPPYAIIITGKVRPQLELLLRGFAALVTHAREDEGIAVSITFADY